MELDSIDDQACMISCRLAAPGNYIAPSTKRVDALHKKTIPLRRIDITMVNKTVVCIFVRIPDGHRDRETLPPLQIYTKALQTAFKAFLSRDMRGAHWFLVPFRSLCTERRVVLADELFRSGQMAA